MTDCYRQCLNSVYGCMAPAESGTVPGEIIGELGTSPLTTEFPARDGPPTTKPHFNRKDNQSLSYNTLSISQLNTISHLI